MYENKKVFDCQEMPDKVRRLFFKVADVMSNDVYVSWSVQASTPEDTISGVKVVDDWLIAKGAVQHESVIIRHWW